MALVMVVTVAVAAAAAAAAAAVVVRSQDVLCKVVPSEGIEKPVSAVCQTVSLLHGLLGLR